LELLRKMLIIREAETFIASHYFEDEMKTPMHMSMGSEHISTGILHTLGSRAIVFNSYRSHAPYLVYTEDLIGFFGEMYGTAAGPNEGRSGSMHITNPDFGHFLSSGIVAAQIPVAVGAAYAEQTKCTDRIAVVFFGDGATNEGDFWESINLACLYHLPILFICEDNDLAVHTRKSSRNGYRDLLDILMQFNLSTFEGENTDIRYVIDATERAIQSIEAGIPALIRWRYHRYLEHVGVRGDYDQGYRSLDEYISWSDKDPIMARVRDLHEGGVPMNAINALHQSVVDMVRQSAKEAKSQDRDYDTTKGIFCE